MHASRLLINIQHIPDSDTINRECYKKRLRKQFTVSFNLKMLKVAS